MDKIKSILSSGGSRKVPPPVPPRPPASAVQKALEKTRGLTQNFSQPVATPIAKGRTVIYTSATSHANNNENKCFDTKLNESSTSLKVS
jgi:hypothetical protein